MFCSLVSDGCVAANSNRSAGNNRMLRASFLLLFNRIKVEIVAIDVSASDVNSPAANTNSSISRSRNIACGDCDRASITKAIMLTMLLLFEV